MTLLFETALPVSRREAFTFFSNPAQLELLHPDRPRVRVLHCEPEVRVGGETWVEVKIGELIPMVLGFRHTSFAPPDSFSETIIHGPFTQFEHRHEFLDLGAKTLVRDYLNFRLNTNYGAEMATRLLVGPEVRRVFARRAERLVALVKRNLW